MAVIVVCHPGQPGTLVLGALCAVAAIDAVANCIPFRPRRRFAAREGVGSDGYQLVQLLRPPRPAHTCAVRDAVLCLPDHQVWYRVVGDDDHTGTAPLVVVHGGPGLPHDYLEPLELLAGKGRRVILYDQAGCGRSTSVQNASLSSIPFFVDELEALRQALQLERIHLWGTGWGGTIALDYALAHPDALCSLTLNGTGASTAENLADLHDLLDDHGDEDRWPRLSARARRLLRDHRAANLNTEAAYQAAALELLQTHFCRLDPWPPCLLAAMRGFGGAMCQALVGTNGIYPSGPLTEWDVRDRLGNLHLPVLVTGGADDEVAPETIEALAAAIPGALWCVFPHSSGTPFLEEPEDYRKVLSTFLDRVDAVAEGCRQHLSDASG